MMPAMYAAISGLEAHQTMLDVTANNLANVDTIGYKAQRTTFVDELSQLIAGGSGRQRHQRRHQPDAGRPRRPGRLDRQHHAAGSSQTTGNTLDVAIQGDGFLRVGNGTPAADRRRPTPPQYTRAGNLTTDATGYLTTAAAST